MVCPFVVFVYIFLLAVECAYSTLQSLNIHHTKTPIMVTNICTAIK